MAARLEVGQRRTAVLRLSGTGLGVPEIAAKLGTSQRTIWRDLASVGLGRRGKSGSGRPGISPKNPPKRESPLDGLRDVERRLLEELERTPEKRLRVKLLDVLLRVRSRLTDIRLTKGQLLAEREQFNPEEVEKSIRDGQDHLEGYKSKNPDWEQVPEKKALVREFQIVLASMKRRLEEKRAEALGARSLHR